ncbi:MAG: hypothetical protein E7311_06640 [Clostridiales bacterium]|nr:hypothetical protein [Clostridiales bacterium]
MFGIYEEDEIDEFEYDEEIETKQKNKIFTYKNIVALVISFLVSQVEFVAGFSPFGMSILAANMANKLPLIISFIAVALGTTIKFGWTSLLQFIITTVVFLVLQVLIRRKKDDREDISKTKLFMSVLLVKLAYVFIGQVLIYDIVLAITTAITTVVFYTVFTYGLYTVLAYKDKAIVATEEMVSASILLCLLISAIGPITVLGLNVRNIVCILVVLVLGWKNGMSIGATSGVTIGSILALVGVGDITLIASYAISGLLAGIFRKFGKIGVIVGFILGNALLAMFANGSTQAIILIKEILVASVALIFMPKRLEYAFDDIFEKTELLPEGRGSGFNVEEQVVYKLNTVSEVFDEMAETLGESASTLVSEKQEVMQFMEDVTGKVCSGCANSEICWKKDLYNKYNMIFDLLDNLLENNEMTIEEFDKIIKGNCIKKEEFVQGLNGTYELYKLNEEWKKKLQENKETISKQLKGFSEVLTSIVADINNKKNNKENKSKIKISTGVAKVSKDNNQINGDNNVILKLSNGQYIIGLSDGMGTGNEAAKNSQLAIDTLEKLVKSGFDKQNAIKLVNSLILLKTEEQESYATLDISAIDAQKLQIEFLKVGACPTFIKKNDKVEIINSMSLPVGIINDVDIDLTEKKLEENDYIIMVTDGIIDSNKELNEEWIIDLLENTDIDNPQRLADVILQEAIDNYFGKPKDDMTVIVSKICEK